MTSIVYYIVLPSNFNCLYSPVNEHTEYWYFPYDATVTSWVRDCFTSRELERKFFASIFPTFSKF